MTSPLDLSRLTPEERETVEQMMADYRTRCHDHGRPDALRLSAQGLSPTALFLLKKWLEEQGTFVHLEDLPPELERNTPPAPAPAPAPSPAGATLSVTSEFFPTAAHASAPAASGLASGPGMKLPRDEWIIGGSPGGERSYLFHARKPRFITRILAGQTDHAPGMTHACRSGALFCEFAWIDPAPEGRDLDSLLAEAEAALDLALNRG